MHALLKYQATWSSFTVTNKHVPFNTFLCIILNILSKSACLGKYLCTKFLLSTCVCNSGDSCRYSFPGLSYTPWMIPCCCGAFSSNSIFRSVLVASTCTGSSSIFGGQYCGVIVSIGMSGGLGGRSRKIRFVQTGNLYLDCP